MARDDGVDAIRQAYREIEPEGFNVPKRQAAELAKLAGADTTWHCVVRAEPFVDEVVFAPQRGVLGLTSTGFFGITEVSRKQYQPFERRLADVADVRELRTGLVRISTADAVADWCVLPLHVKALLGWANDLLLADRPAPPPWVAVPFAWPATAAYRGDHPGHPAANDEVEIVADASGIRVTTVRSRQTILAFPWSGIRSLTATGDSACVVDADGRATFTERVATDALDRILRPAAAGYRP